MNQRNLIIGLAALVIVGAGSGYYFYAKAQQARDPQKAAQDDAKKWVAAVGKLMVLPDELPIIATVAEPDKLKGQAFFQNAQKGDKVLIYNNAHKAVLYNPTENRVVDVAPLSIGNTQVSPTPTPSPTPAN